MQLLQIIARRLKQHECPDDVRVHELPGAIDGAVDMALGGQMVDDLRPEFGEGSSHRGSVADVCLQEVEILAFGGITEGGKLARIA